MAPLPPLSTFVHSVLAPIALASGLSLSPALAEPGPLDAGDDEYRFLAGLLDKGLFEMAVDEGLAFLESYPRHAKAPLARYRLATALFELERREEARPHYASLVSDPDFAYRAEATFRLGQCHLTAGSLEEAGAAFRSVLALDQTYLHGPATFFRAETEFRRGAHGSAQASYTELLRRHADSEYVSAARRGLVWCAWERHDVDATIERARAALESSEGDEAAEIGLLLGEALLEKPRPEEALAAFTAVRSERLADARLRGIGFANAARGDHGAAARAFRELLRTHGTSRYAGEARLQLGIALLRSGDASGAVRTLEGAARPPRNGRRAAAGVEPELLYWLSEAQAANGDRADALRTLERARTLELGPELRTRVEIARGELLTSLGRSDEALAAYESAGSDYALYAAAVARWNEEDPERAIALVDQLLGEHAESTYLPRARHIRAEALLSLERFGEAERAFASVLASEVEPQLAAQCMDRMAWCRYRTGDLDGALQRFEQLLRRHPDQEVARESSAMLAHVLLEADRRDEARAAGLRHLERYGDDGRRDQVLLTTARASDGEEALEHLRTLVREIPASSLVPRALFELGERLSEEESYDGAAEAYAQVLRDHPQSEVVPEAGYALGWCLVRLERFDESGELLEWVGARENASPQLAEASWELAVWAWSKSPDPARATRAWQRFARRTQDDARRLQAARTVVAAWRDAGRPADGQRVLDELLRLASDPGVALDVLLEGAYLALEEGDVDRAEAQVEVARKRSEASPRVAEASFFVGEARFEAGSRERAVALYRSACSEGSPVRAEASYKLGFALLEAEDNAGAAGAFATVVERYPDDELWGESLFLLGEALYRNGNLEQAAQAFERVRREAPEHDVLPRALFRLGLAAGRLERWSVCEEVLNQLARSAPEFENRAEAELWRGRALAAQRKRRAARQAFERVAELDRGELAAQARLALGRLIEAEGRTEEALSEYLKVALLYAHDEEVAEALFRAGACLEALGDPDKAAEQYREVLSAHPDTRFAPRARESLERLR